MQHRVITNTPYMIDFHIVDSRVKAILGLTDCLQLGLLSVNNNIVYHVATDSTSTQLFTDYKDLFDGSLGSLLIYSMTIDPNATPVVRPHDAFQQQCKTRSSPN